MPLILSGDTGISGVDGSAGTPSLQGTDSNTGVFYATDIVGISTGGSERMRIDSSGNVGIGTNSPTNYGANYKTLDIKGTTQGSLVLGHGTTNDFIAYGASTESGLATLTATPLIFQTNSTERMRIDSSGNVGIGTSSPGTQLDVNNGSANTTIRARTGSSYSATLSLLPNGSGSGIALSAQADNSAVLYNQLNSYLAFGTNNTERMRITSGGDVGIGTSSPAQRLHIVGNQQLIRFATTAAESSSMNANTTNSVIGISAPYGANPSSTSNGGAKWGITFTGNGDSATTIGGAKSASIFAISEETAAGYNRSVGLSFFTSAFDANQTERMRITSGGVVLVGKTSDDSTVAGSALRSTGVIVAVASGTAPILCNRLASDGNLVEFYQDTVLEGNISVSGTTVSYNGGHLSRWAQLPNNAKDDTLLKGTVMSNLDDMCVWTKDGEVLPNEQLNKMKVSDVEGDTNVAGVFVNWTFDEQCQSYDMNVAMTGDMIIRIAQGVVVQKGDLLMSAGDGTAKPQGDDIVRSKTVAKVTSNHVTCTYADGSYCVPCVLMAC